MLWTSSKIIIKRLRPKKILGSHTLTRNEWIEHNSNISKSLFDLNENQLSVVADGTYIYCEKSKNKKLQKELYSMHKYRNLVKPFV